MDIIRGLKTNKNHIKTKHRLNYVSIHVVECFMSENDFLSHTFCDTEKCNTTDN